MCFGGCLTLMALLITLTVDLKVTPDKESVAEF
jgi:hypothetical protein